MKVVTYEATVENGQIRLTARVRLPERPIRSVSEASETCR
jgi:hypothetical protein